MASFEIKSESAEQTVELATKIGGALKGGECIELISDVGGGKTTFVRGLAKGAGSNSHVSSPTFTISKTYKTKKFDIVHFDFYRLHEPGLIEHEIEESVHENRDVIVIEWSEIVKHVLPEKRMTIMITAKNNERVLKFEYPNELAYLLESFK